MSDNSWNISTDATNYTVTGLMPRQSYNFTVRAKNSIGEGNTSTSVTVITIES